MKERLKTVRKNLNLTQEEFSNILGIKRTSYASYETGRVIPTAPFIKLICNKYNVSENWLVNGIGEMYIKSEDDLLNALKKKYKLTDLEYEILKSYLNLDAKQREAVSDFIENDIINKFIGKIINPSSHLLHKDADNAIAEFRNTDKENVEEKQELG